MIVEITYSICRLQKPSTCGCSSKNWLYKMDKPWEFRGTTVQHLNGQPQCGILFPLGIYQTPTFAVTRSSTNARCPNQIRLSSDILIFPERSRLLGPLLKSCLSIFFRWFSCHCARAATGSISINLRCLFFAQGCLLPARWHERQCNPPVWVFKWTDPILNQDLYW